MRIFISYSSKNRPRVLQVQSALNDFGHDVWIDQELSGGQHWWDSILEEIRGCDLFMIALSPEWLDSMPCQLEYNYARALGKHLLPVHIIDVVIEHLAADLQGLQIVDCREDTPEHFKVVLRAINKLPPPTLLPDPLPVPPAMPVSELAELGKKIKAPTLSGEEQSAILLRLRVLLDDPRDGEQAHKLIQQLKTHPDVRLATVKEIEALIGAPLPPPQPQPPIETVRPAAHVIEVPPPPLRRAPLSPRAITSANVTQIVKTSVLSNPITEDAIPPEIRQAYPVITTVDHNASMSDLAFSPDGSLLTVISRRRFYRYKKRFGTKVDGSQETSDIGRIDVYRIPDGTHLHTRETFHHTLPRRQTKASVEHLRNLAFTDDGRYLVTQRDTTGYLAISVFDTQSWDVIQNIQIQKAPTYVYNPDYSGSPRTPFDGRIAVSPRGAIVAIGGGQTVHMVSLYQPDEPFAFDLTQGGLEIDQVIFAPQGHLLAVVAGQTEISFWRIPDSMYTGQTQQSLQHLAAFRARKFGYYTNPALTFSPDGKILALGDKDSVRTWNVATQRELPAFDGVGEPSNQCLAFSPDGSLLAVSSIYHDTPTNKQEPGCRIAVFDVASRNSIKTIIIDEEPFPSFYGSRILPIAFSPDGSLLAVGYGDQVQLFTLP